MRGNEPEDWKQRALLFVDHIHWLWGEYSDQFLDFLGHAEQEPGVLPHFGWIHISRVHGKGRNWVSGVLARLWPGNVASSLDLMSILDDSFNDRLSRCICAIVDEINEGGSQSYQHAQALRQLVTAEVREINPKYGRRHMEYNSTRWIFFSNHTGALPLGDEDRRFFVVEHEGPVRDTAYYERLYRALDDPLFIASVAEFLRTRDLSNFWPGRLPPMTRAKAALIDFSRSEDDEKFRELAACWPVEVISAAELRDLFAFDVLQRKSTKHSMDRAGIRKLKKIRINHVPEIVYALCDYDYWTKRSPDEVRLEINSASRELKLEHMERDDADRRVRL
nr:primase-helicase family protein [Qipengyuania xiamenensis]